MNPIQFYTSVDVTLSEKLLEVMYCLIGLISMYVAFKNLGLTSNLVTLL